MINSNSSTTTTHDIQDSVNTSNIFKIPVNTSNESLPKELKDFFACMQGHTLLSGGHYNFTYNKVKSVFAKLPACLSTTIFAMHHRSFSHLLLPFHTCKLVWISWTKHPSHSPFLPLFSSSIKHNVNFLLLHTHITKVFLFK